MIEGIFRIDALPSERLDAIRRAGIDDGGNALPPPLDAGGSEPLRCCLRLGKPGEQLLLIAYRPLERPGPYAETGPVFIHAGACGGYRRHSLYPEEFRGRQQVFRCYDDADVITGGRLSGPDEKAEAVIAELFADEKVQRIHTRNVVFGCYMLQVRRCA
jgi:hypothetical protein